MSLPCILNQLKEVKMTAYIQFKKIAKSYGSAQVINNLDFSIKQGEFVSLLGPSGSGKTTLLMLLAGFEQLSAGEIWVNAERIDHLPPHKRNMGVVFQSYALFPHLTIAQNIAFPLACRKLSKTEIKARVRTVLDMVKLTHLAERKPSQLSGGQQQRIALARALVFEPKIILMDEPLGALDKQLREHMQMEIRALHQELGLTIVFVTHDQTEAITMSDRVAVFNGGKIEQVDSPEHIYHRPKTQFVADFIGQTNMLPARRLENGEEVSLSCGQVIRLNGALAHIESKDLLLSIRPESLRINQKRDNEVSIIATVKDAVFQGDHTRIHANYEGMDLVARLEPHLMPLTIGQNIEFSFSPDDCAPLCKN